MVFSWDEATMTTTTDIENQAATEGKKDVFEYPRRIMLSYGSRELFTQWISAAFGFTVFFYYESVIGLDVRLAAAAYIIYQVWNSINDPLTGYLMERVVFPWEKKSGFRRMPIIIVSAFLWLLSYVAIFMGPTYASPSASQWFIFAWYVISLCLYDTFGTLFDVNVVSLYPEKFTGLNERRVVQAMGTSLGIIGLVLAAIIPPMFITTGVAITYRNSALVTFAVGLILLVLMLPGIYETKRVREVYRLRRENLAQMDKREGFFATARIVFSNKRFVGKVILFFGYQVGVVMLQTSAFYIVTYLLDAPASTISLLLGSMLIGALISVPVWMVISRKTNNNRMVSVVGGLFLSLTFVPMIFIHGLTGWVVCLVFFGMALGNQWFMDPPTMADILDDVAVKTGRRDPSIYISYQSLVFKLGYTSIAVVIAAVHTWTGFPAGVTSLAELLQKSPTPQLALFGIRIHSAVVPAIVALIATIIFWLVYDLTPARVMTNKKKLEEMGL
jgi:GPH family glycoside/pentoside/hexuronide:cation symporter